MTFPGFQPETLQALLVDGTGERWQAVQERLHPVLHALVEQLDTAARERLGRIWPLYEISWKTARYRNRGRGQREPINEYHVAIDRMPRGAGLYLGVSSDERAILVGFTSTGARKREIQRIWETGRGVWDPLLQTLPEVRFMRSEGHQTNRWIEDYLESRQARYLWAGYRYSWDDPQIATPQFAPTLIEDVLRLLPFNEAVMEAAQLLDVDVDLAVREQRAQYAVPGELPPVETIIERIQQRGFTYPDALLRSYHVALQTKPLAILPGVSGMGKTRLTRLYADAVHGISADAADNPYYLLVAVQPDWHNAKDLLGYYNALTGVFQPTALLRFMIGAAAEPQQPFYVCLDEMNLARPEYYLAPILSALETTEHSVDLGAPSNTITLADGATLRTPFVLPLNVYFTGTVNVDESTFGLSDKLLDRANLIELNDVDLAAFRRVYRQPIHPDAWRIIEQTLVIMQQVGQPFGYRTVAEMLRYLDRARGVLPTQQALDLQIKQKVLPKLRGDDTPRLRQALHALLDLYAGTGADVDAELPASAALPQSAAKVQRMLQRLDRDGLTDFYGS